MSYLDCSLKYVTADAFHLTEFLPKSCGGDVQIELLAVGNVRLRGAVGEELEIGLHIAVVK